MHSERRQAREAVLQSLYALELGGGSAEHVVRVVLMPRLPEEPSASNFGQQLLKRIIDMDKAADALVIEHAKNWALERMALIDKLLMRMAVTEFLCFEDVPPKVTINEVLELAKQYSTGQSNQFINGILDSVVYSLRSRGQLQKSRAGRIGMEALERRQDAERSNSS